MEFLSSKKLSHVDGLSRLIPTSSEPLEDIVITSLQAENELVEVWSYVSHGAQCGVTTSHSTCCGCCIRDYHICFRLFAFVKSFRAHTVFERSTKGG